MNLYALPIGAEVDDFLDDPIRLCRAVIAFFLDWKTPPATVRIVILDADSCIVEAEGGER